LQTAATAGFSLKISGFLAAVKLTDKSGYPLSGYPDMQTLHLANEMKVKTRRRLAL